MNLSPFHSSVVILKPNSFTKMYEDNNTLMYASQTGSGAVTPPTRSWMLMKGADDLILCLELNPGQWKPSGGG